MPALRVLRLTQGCSEVTAAAAARIARTLPRLDAQLVPSQPAQHEQQHEQPQLTP